MLYAASFDLRDGRHAFGNVTFKATGLPNFVVNLATDVLGPRLEGGTTAVFNHYGMNQFIGEDGQLQAQGGYGLCGTPFATIFTGVMRTKAAAAGWDEPTQLDLEFNGTDYRFNYFFNFFTGIDFSNGSTKRLFGFSENFAGLQETVIADGLPNFIIRPILTAVTMEGSDGYIYEPKGMSAAAVSPAGMQYGLSRTKPPLFRNWVQQSETRSRTLRAAASSAHPCTHELLFESCRSVYPFAVIDGFGDGLDYLFRLRPEGSMWSMDTCKHARNDMDDALFDVRYRAQQIGSISFSL